MTSHDTNLDGKLAARFGGGKLAKQAARQALVNRNKQQKAESTDNTSHSVSSIQSQCRQPASMTPATNKAAATHGEQVAGPKRSSQSSQCSRPSSARKLHNKAADESISPDLDEIMGVMEALGGARCNPAACCPSKEQRQPESSNAPPRSGDTLQVSSTAIASPSGSSRDNSRSPVNCAGHFSATESSNSGQQQYQVNSAEQQTVPTLQQFEQEYQLQVEQQQQQQGNGSKPSSPAATHARASMLSSKVPSGKGPVTAVKPAVFNFDEAHPVLADKHYLRTKEQERMLTSSRASSPSGSKGKTIHSPTSRPPGTAQSAAAAGSFLTTQSHWATSNDAVGLSAGFSTKPRPKSAMAPRCKTSSSSDAVGCERPIAVLHGSLASAAAVFEQHGNFLSSGDPLSSAQGWGAGGAINTVTEAMSTDEHAARSASSSTGGSIAARQELLKVMKQAQQAMAASAHLRTRQNTHLPAASSSLASWASSAGAAAAAVAADALASRGVVTAGNRLGWEGFKGGLTWSNRAADDEEVGPGQTWSNKTAADASADAADKDRQIQELASKVGHLKDSLALLLSCKPLPAEAAAALTAALGQHDVMSAEQLKAVTASTVRADELEDVISTINQGEGLGQLQKPSRQQQQQQQCILEPPLPQQQCESEMSSEVRPDDTVRASDSSSVNEVSHDSAAAAAASEDSETCEMRLACGAFDEDRYEEFNKQVDAAMERRAAEQDYDSDLEEEEKAAIRANDEAAEALLELQEAERKLEELNGQQAQLQATWAEQDEWMNEYRQLSEQQQQQHGDDGAMSGSEADNDEHGDAQHTQHHRDLQQQWHAAAEVAAARGRAAAESAAAAAAERGQMAAAAAAAAAVVPAMGKSAHADRSSGCSSTSKQRQVLSPADEALISMPFIPRMEQSLPDHAAVTASLAASSEYQQQQQQTTLDNPSACVDCTPQQQQEFEGNGYSSDNGGGYHLGQERNREMGTPSSLPNVNRAGGSYASKARFSIRSRSASPHFKTTIAQPFTFEVAAAIKPKSIAAVKLEQDLVLKAQEEEAHYSRRFVASPIPASTLEPRYLNIIADQAAKRAVSRTRYKELLASQECPFTFYERDKDAAAAKAARRAAARDPNRFQQPFKAKPVPAHVHERRYESTAVGLEAARLAAKVRAEMAREKAAAKLQEAYKKRQHLAEAAYNERLAGSSSTSPTKYRQPWHPSGTNAIQGTLSQRNLSKSTSALQQQLHTGGRSQDGHLPLHSYGSGLGDHSQSAISSLARRAGSAGSSPVRTASTSGQYHNSVPDFKALHAQWEARMAAIKASNRRRVTVPEEFCLNGSTLEEQAERTKKQAERRTRIVATMAEDAQNLRELRWPYVSSRAPVYPTPPPAHLAGCAQPKSAEVGGTLAAQLRAETTRQAMAAGKYDTAEERERKQWVAMKAQQQQRQQQWQAVQASELRKRLEQHQQQLEHQRQKRLQQGLPSTSTTGGGSVTDQSRGMSAAGADAANTAAAAASATGKAGIDAAAAAAAGRAVAAASAAQGGVPPSAAEVAAHLDQLLKGKAKITPAQLDQQEQQQQQLPREVAFSSATDHDRDSSNGSSPHKSSSSPAWIRRMIHSSRKTSRESSLRRSGDAATAGGRSSSGGCSVSRRAGLSGREEAPLMHIEARHAQAEKAAREMVEDALLQQGIEAYRYVEG